jgi:hypothetical protein
VIFRGDDSQAGTSIEVDQGLLAIACMAGIKVKDRKLLFSYAI